MRDLVEIGMGRTARRTYELDDVNIVPSRRTRSSKEVSTAWQLDAYRFDIPVLAHPTDALVSPTFAIELGKRGGLGVINGEGLWGRHPDVEEKLRRLVEIDRRFTGTKAAACIIRSITRKPPKRRWIPCLFLDSAPFCSRFAVIFAAFVAASHQGA